MEFVHPSKVKRLKEAREHLADMQRRIYQLENNLDDLMRSVEIAQYTKQYNVTEVFVTQANELLQDRLIIPELDQSDQKFTVVEGTVSEETKEAIKERNAQVR